MTARLDRFVLTKFQKRLWVTNEATGERIYTPPDFLLISSRAQFAGLLDDLNKGSIPIEAIQWFETNTKRKQIG